MLRPKYLMLVMINMVYLSKSFSQNNPEFSQAVRISTSYSGYSGLMFHFEYEKQVSPKGSLIGSINTDFNKRKGIGLDYRYNFFKYKKFESNIGVGIYGDVINTRESGKSKNEYYLSLKPVIEFRYNFNKSTYLFGSAKTTLQLYNSRIPGDEIQSLHLGVAKRF